MTEIEVKFPEIDADKLREKLRSLGAKLISPERMMKRKLFDYPDRRLDAEHKWVRLRDEGDKITLAFKSWHGNTIDGLREISLTVSDFDKTEEFLGRSGLRRRRIRKASAKVGNTRACRLKSIPGHGSRPLWSWKARARRR